MNILIIGAGGREHALSWKIAQSPSVGTLYSAPGNGGMEDLATSIDLDVTSHQSVIQFCHDMAIGLVVVGPEAPLVDGLVDSLSDADIPAFGPGKISAQLEGSKGFTKDICSRYNIPTAAYKRLTNLSDAQAYLKDVRAPIVIKADGLAAGKGVIIAHTTDEAEAALSDMFMGSFGDAGAEVVMEAFLSGEEASFFAVSDGNIALPLATAQDHKTAHDGDLGPNTGGMGAYSPAPVMTDALIQQTMETIINPTLQAMRDMGAPYKGVLYAGLMITKTGPQLIEYNARFGDPECQVLMTRMTSDILPLLLGSAIGDISDQTVEWSAEKALTVVLAAKGYPGSYEKGTRIKGLTAASRIEGVTIFHAGTAAVDGSIMAVGGRVLNITASGETVQQAQSRAYEAIKLIEWPEGFCRSDIGWRAIARENTE